MLSPSYAWSHWCTSKQISSSQSNKAYLSEKKKGHYFLLSFNLKSPCLLLVGGKFLLDAAFMGIRLHTFTYEQTYFEKIFYADVHNTPSTLKRTHHSTAGSATWTNWKEHAHPSWNTFYDLSPPTKLRGGNYSHSQCFLVGQLVRVTQNDCSCPTWSVAAKRS